MADWKFLDKTIPVTRPPLPNDFGVGSDVVIVTIGTRNTDILEGVVVKKGRVWVTVAPVDQPSYRVWRFRLDTQTDGSGRGFPMFFRTPEQHRYFEALADASKYFFTIGLRTEGYGGSPVKKANIIELARLIYNSGLIPGNSREL